MLDTFQLARLKNLASNFWTDAEIAARLQLTPFQVAQERKRMGIKHKTGRQPVVPVVTVVTSVPLTSSKHIVPRGNRIQQAIQLIAESKGSMSVTEAAKKLGISGGNIYTWMKRMEKDGTLDPRIKRRPAVDLIEAAHKKAEKVEKRVYKAKLKEAITTSKAKRKARKAKARKAKP